MKKLILMNNSKLIYIYLTIFLVITTLVGFNSTDYLSGEQYGYWYLNKIFINEFLFPDVSRSPIYVIYLSLFNWLNAPYNFIVESIFSNFILCISLFFIFKKYYNNFYVFFIIALSIGFFFNFIPYPQLLALSFLNFSIILRKDNKISFYILSYLFIILAIYCRITYIIVFVLFIFFDVSKEVINFKNTSKLNHKKNLTIFSIVLFFFFTDLFLKDRMALSKFNNGYFQSLKWKPSKSTSNIDIAFQVNFNYLYYEKNKSKIDNQKKDFYFVNKIAFNGSQTMYESIKSNPNFFIWGIIKNAKHVVPIILNKFNSRNYFPKCSKNGHSCYSNYFYIGSIFILFIFFNYHFFIKKKFENDLDIKCYALINYVLIFSTILAMPKIRYMTPFIFFLVPFNMYIISLITKKIKKKNVSLLISIFIIFSFSFFNYTFKYLSDYFSIEKIYTKINFIKNYSKNLDELKLEINKCESILTSNPTFILSNIEFREKNIFSLVDIPPFGSYKEKQNLNIYENLKINCILLDEEMKSSSGASRGTGTDYEFRRKYYLKPFLKFNMKNIVKNIDYSQFGNLYVYSIK